MATSEPLVPTGLPYGERQNVKEGMARAGIPMAPTGQAPAAAGPRQFIQGTPTGARPVRPDFDPLLEASPDQFGFLAGGGETPELPAAAPDNASVFAQLAATAQSGLARAIAARLSANQGS